jgi:hypothetical protein
MIKYDDLDECLIGLSSSWDTSGKTIERLVYSGDKMIEKFMREGSSYDDAQEHISFNIEGGYLGESTPIIVWAIDPEELDLLCNSET